jgi:hypothetical protein
VTAQHDRVIASHAVFERAVAASAQPAEQTHDPSVHYQQVRDSWFGVRNARQLDLVGLFGEWTTNGPSNLEDRSLR